jgi:hypothetical protein
LYGDSEAAFSLLDFVVDADKSKIVLEAAKTSETWYVDAFVEALNLRKIDTEQRFLENSEEERRRMSEALFEMLLRVVERIPTISATTGRVEGYTVVRPEALGALYWALNEGNLEVLERVLLHGVDVNTKKEPFKKHSALFKAVTFFLKNPIIGRLMINELLDVGVIIDDRIVSEMTTVDLAQLPRLKAACKEYQMRVIAVEYMQRPVGQSVCAGRLG